MTVPAQDPVTTHAANGVTTVFPFGFLCLDPVDLKVLVDYELADTSTYSVSDFGSNTGGSITFLTAPENGLSIIIRLDVVLNRTTSYQFNGDFMTPVVNKDFDRLWLSQQSQQVDLESSVKFAPGEKAGFLPSIAVRKGKALVFNADTGQPEPSVDDYNDQAQVAAASAKAAETSNTSAQSAATAANEDAEKARLSALSAKQSADNAEEALTEIAAHVTVVPVGNITQTNAQDALAGLDVRTTTIETSTWILAGVAGLVKPSYEFPCLIKTGPSSLSVAAGTHVPIAGAWVSFTSEKPVVMPALIPGTDYSVWVKPDGTAQAVADTYASPAVAPAPGAVRRGGFHCGLVAPGETVAGGQFSTGPVTGSGGPMAWTQGDVDRLAGINEFSLWDLAWRCAGEQYGMAYSPLSQTWIAIYFCSTSPHLNGISAFNTNVASGTVLPFVPLEWGGDGVLKYTSLRSWEAMELVSAHGLRLIKSIEEFIPAAFGVTEGVSLGGGAVTIPSTKREPRFTSRYGMEQATGHQHVIGAPYNAVGGSAYAGNGRGSWYGSYGMPLYGGHRDAAANSGSRAAFFSDALSTSNWASSVRAAGDHLKLVGAAR